jgi:preprotein translocase subunit SecG
MQQILPFIQIVVGVILISCILLQAQGAGFGTTWSGGGETYHTKRGIEKVVFYLTIVFVAIFILTSLGLMMR